MLNKLNYYRDIIKAYNNKRINYKKVNAPFACLQLQLTSGEYSGACNDCGNYFSGCNYLCPLAIYKKKGLL